MVTESTSAFSSIQPAAPDPILGLTEAFNADPNPHKINLGVGVYQDGSGKVPILRVVKESEARWLDKEDSKSYLPMDGVPAYNKAVQRLLFGAESEVVHAGSVVTAQALGGTGALKIGADFLRRFFPESGVWISDPSWENHRALFESAGFRVQTYAYYNPETHGLDFPAMLSGLLALPERSIVVLHAACHNPTGVDLGPEQWREVVDVVRERGLMPYLDFAYQGFGAGVEEDAFAVRAFAQAGISCLIASSFSKSFSLYRERVGALTVLTDNAAEAKAVLTQIKPVIRTNYSNPASHGGQIVALVLGDTDLRSRWEAEVTEMRERILEMRSLFVRTLREKAARQDFGFIERQRGMFSYSGLPLDVVRRLREEKSLYILDSGRICVAAMNERNMPYICESIAWALNEA